MPIRWLSRVEKIDGSRTVIFPSHRYEYEQAQTLQSAFMQLVGEDYAFDQLEGAPSLKDNASERVRFLDVGDVEDIDEDVDKFKEISGWGTLIVVTSGSSGERKARARPEAMPGITFTVENLRHLPVLMSFIRSTNWYVAEQTSTIVLSSDPQTIIVTNPGNAEALDPIIIIKGAFTNPIITNNSAPLEGTTTGHRLQSTRDGSGAATWLKFDARQNSVEYSINSGVSWADDSFNYTLQAGQLRLMLLAPGPNSLVIVGCNGCTIVVTSAGAWH